MKPFSSIIGMFQWNAARRLILFLAAAVVWHVGGPARVDAAESAEPITLELWDFPHMPETAAYLQDSIREFESKNPGVRVRYTRLPWQDGQQKVTLAVLGGQPPDVCCQVSNNISGFIAQDVLEPLNDALAPELDDFYPSYIDAVSFKGDIYAVPWYKACYVMALNLDVFEHFGVAPPANGRWTWDEFLQKMQALTRRAPAPDDRLKPSLNSPAGPPTQYYGLVTNLGVAEYEAYNIIYNFGGRILQKSPTGGAEATADSAAFISGLEHLQNLDFKWHVAAPGIGAFTQEQSWKVWKEGGAVATTIQGGWIINALNTSNREQERANARLTAAGREAEARRPFRWMLAAPPTVDARTTPVLASSGLGTFVVFRQKDAVRRKLAKELALHLVRGRGQEVLKQECVFPSRRSAGNPYGDDPMIGPVFDLFPDAVLTPLVPGGERIDRVFQQEIQKALLRVPGTDKPQATADAAARAANAKTEAVLDRAKRRFERK
jgi:multiple sugar transport system substrate-binding protein